MGLISNIKKIKYLRILKRETNDNVFLSKVNMLLSKISRLNKDITDDKINSHFDKIKSMFLY